MSRASRIVCLLFLVGTVILAAVALRWFGDAREEVRLASCRPVYLYELASRFASVDTGGLFPPLSSVPGRLIYDPEFLRNQIGIVRDHFCDSDPNPPAPALLVHSNDAFKNVDDWSYVYLGYVIESQAQLEAFAAAYKRIVAEGGDFTADLKVPMGQGNCRGDTIYRLRTKAELLKVLPCLEGRLGELPVVIEWPGNHRDGVAQAMFYGAESQVQLTYPGEWPMTEAAIALLRELDGMERPVSTMTRGGN